MCPESNLVRLVSFINNELLVYTECINGKKQLNLVYRYILAFMYFEILLKRLKREQMSHKLRFEPKNEILKQYYPIASWKWGENIAHLYITQYTILRLQFRIPVPPGEAAKARSAYDLCNFPDNKPHYFQFYFCLMTIDHSITGALSSNQASYKIGYISLFRKYAVMHAYG